MSRPITPGQTVPVPFTLSEVPDSTPTLTVYRSTAAGVLSDVTATTAPVVTQLGAGLEYHAYYTVPAGVLHGTGFQLLASVTIGGETTTHWLDGGSVELWASQASVDEVAAKTALITSGGVSVVSPVFLGGRIVVTEGFDYAAEGGSAEITITEASVGDWDADRLLADSFTFYARHDTEDDVDFSVACVLNPADGDGLRSFTFNVLRTDVPQVGAYTYHVYGTFDATSRDVPIVKGAFRSERGRIVEA